MTSLEGWQIYLVMVVAGVGTLALRFSFIGLLRRGVDEIPELARRVLRLVPAAVLAAIVAPGLTHPGTVLDPWNVRMLAGAVAAVAAWRTRNVSATIAVGMAALWLLQAMT